MDYLENNTQIITEQDKEFMREAIRLADESVKNGGGPFGAVIVKDGEIIAGRSNTVTIDTSCEPCPMCLGSIYWAHISRIFYGNTRKDARDIDFADDFIYEELDRPLYARTVPIMPLLRDEALNSFRLWKTKTDKKEY